MQFNPNDDMKRFGMTANQRPRWFAGTLAAILLIGLTSWMQNRDADGLKTERAADKRAQLDRILTKAGCPAKQAGDTDIITLTFDTSADSHTDKPMRTTVCMRYVDRGYMRMQQASKKKQQVAEARVGR